MSDFISYENWKKGKSFLREYTIYGPDIEGYLSDVIAKLTKFKKENLDKEIYLSITTDGYDCAFEQYTYTKEDSEEEKLAQYGCEKESFLKKLAEKQTEKDKIRKKKEAQINKLQEELAKL